MARKRITKGLTLNTGKRKSSLTVKSGKVSFNIPITSSKKGAKNTGCLLLTIPLLLVPLFLFLLSCGNNNNEISKEENITFPIYSNVMEMLEASGDYTGNQVESISNENGINHIRISSEFLKEEMQSNIKEQVKRDIVYVAFQTFAQTNLDKIKITATPIIRGSFNPNLKYDGRLQENLTETVAISRTKAKKIIEKYLKTSSFRDLYELSGTIYVPSSKFDRLKLTELSNVFADMKK